MAVVVEDSRKTAVQLIAAEWPPLQSFVVD
jgi:hypothetical protein